MGHHHHHDHQQSSKNIKVAFFLNLGFTIIEFIGGIYTNSLAITSDALHDLGDSLSLGLSWYFHKLSTKKPNKIFSYGYKRFSLLGAIINAMVLIIGAVYIVYTAIPRIIHPEDTDAKGMMYFAILGIVINGAAVFSLKKGTSMNEKVVALHLIEDVLGWVAVLIASLVMQFYDLPILDPILSLVITGYVLYNLYHNMRESFRIILQGTPENISIEKIKKRILGFEEVKSIHNLHLWSMDGTYNVFSVHIVLVDKNSTLQQTTILKQQINKILQNDFDLNHITIELEVSHKKI
jgi:cobalt-zinc-cadmium efflux system protein